ncbi:hypothetical protein SAMN04488030_0844 [Aliiroseovarius halocynthiae]|uniref:DUF1905 domain-containing protein n=1 Tax=Aliiroseovarius halocynthiae TaxID=985055 RepID=A0A545SV08_9RHOB|nr:hypothetical protein [Aliiroseovarius halocynthiae]TQV68791.1 hypothetical protein FIL88_04205 [Aliiroseovarius halocynthiae]SMR71217.1 hypothetical protein SAMN04488030_0844 [Aliiroseovarius halocynthiae]
MTQTAIRFEAVILRKQDDLPRYIIIKPEIARAFSGSFDAQVSLNDGQLFHRRIHPWGKGSDAYFFNLTKVQCYKAELGTGDMCHVTVIPV